MAAQKNYGLTYDVIIIGSGIAGALLAYKLAKEKVRVLVLEAGGMPNELAGRSMLVRNFAASGPKGQDSPYVEETDSAYFRSPTTATAPQPTDEMPDPHYRYVDKSLPFKSLYERLVGGSLWHWQGLVPRMVPNDFRMNKAYGLKQVRDWPISYSDLAPYYREAEYEMGVAGNVETDRDLDRLFGLSDEESLRGYPKGFREGIPMTYLDKYLGRKLNGISFEPKLPGQTLGKIPLRVTQIPQAKNAQPFDGRPACDGHGTCVPLCPTRAKYEALFHVEKAIKAGAELHTNAVVTQLVFDSSLKVSKVTYVDWMKNQKSIEARIVVLAGNAIESPRLLLHSQSKNPWIGKFLMDHPGTSSYGLVAEPVYPFRGPSTTSHIATTSEGPFRKFHAGFRTSLLNYGWVTGAPRGAKLDNPALDFPKHDPSAPDPDRAGTVLDFVHRSKLIGSALREKIKDHAHRQIVLGSALEQLPHDGNSVALHATEKDKFDVPLPLISYDYDDPSGYTAQGLKVLRQLHEYVFQRLGATAYRLFSLDDQGRFKLPDAHFGAGHIMGTTTMGVKGDGKPSVVDAQCRSVDHSNLYIVGSSVFVTGAVANPTLTIAALSLRAADAIKKDLREAV